VEFLNVKCETCEICLILCSDGEVTNPQECINTVRRHANTTRVFTFGIGNDADKNLVR
jgi:MinD superfamily P-loop ATPase